MEFGNGTQQSIKSPLR